MIRSWQGNHPKIHSSAFISESAYVVGSVEVGENSSVWPATVIRGDSGKIIVGKNTYTVEVSQDEEGNGAGFLFGLPDPKS